MLPTELISKDASKDVKTLIIIGLAVWGAATIVHSIAQYHLFKVQRDLAKVQMKKLEAEGFKL